MKPVHYLYFLAVMIGILTGCVSNSVRNSSALTPIKKLLTTPSSLEQSTPILMSTSAPTSNPTQSQAPMSPTLESEQARDKIQSLLQKPGDCSAPCLWGITPGQTTLSEAERIFTNFGLQIKSTTQGNKDFYGTTYSLDNGLSVTVILTTQNKVVKDIRMQINPEIRQTGVPRAWSAYSPEVLTGQYGQPSRVEIFLGRGAPQILYAMVIYFDSVDLIGEYSGYDVKTVAANTFRICPLNDQTDSVRIWLGKNPQYPPGHAVPLEDVTSLTLDSFTKLMRNSPKEACFNVKGDKFP